MALVIKDRVLETCNSPGTGTVTLLGAVTGYQTFNAAVGTGNTCYYAIADQSGNNWEVGVGTFTAPASLGRTTVLASSNGGSVVNFAIGVQNVFLTYPADKAVTTDTLAYPPAIGATTPNSGAFTTLTATQDSSFTSTGALLISKGTSLQQPGGAVTGMLRYNTTTNQFEGYSGSSPGWNSLGGITIADDTTSTSAYYPLFSTATSGTVTAQYVSSTKFTYKPSTGELGANLFAAKSSGGGTITLSPASTASSFTLTLPAKTGTLATTADIFDAGTKTNFFQAAAPTGWTQCTTYNDYAIRIVNTAGGGTGGSVNFSTAFVNQSVTGTVGATTLSLAQIPSHNHQGGMTIGVGTPVFCTATYPALPNTTTRQANAPGTSVTVNAVPVQYISVASNGSSSSHNHSFSGTSINMAVKYVNNIIAVKN